MSSERWVSYIEPATANYTEPVWVCMPESTAIAIQKEAALSTSKQHAYESDAQALEDFMVVHWASWCKPVEQLPPEKV